MNKAVVITMQVDERTLALVDKVAEAHGQSRDGFVEQAVREAAEREAEFLAFVQEGIDAADRGDVVPHEEVFARLKARRRTRSAA